MTVVWAIVAVFLGSAGQVCLKLGVDDLPLAKAILQPYTLCGYILYGASSLFWLLVLKRLPLSVAYPLLSLNFVFVFVLSSLILKEPASLAKIAGTGLVIAGILLIQSGQI